jgi:opacity protein-like surface antigen
MQQERNMWKILTAASTAIALLGAPALADMAEWDANADSTIDQNEFGSGFGGGGVFSQWDADSDSALSEDEWNAGFQSNLEDDYDQSEFGAFSDWDASGDSMLDESEFNEGVFGAYDDDADSMWGEEEYAEYEDDEWF